MGCVVCRLCRPSQGYEAPPAYNVLNDEKALSGAEAGSESGTDLSLADEPIVVTAAKDVKADVPVRIFTTVSGVTNQVDGLRSWQQIFDYLDRIKAPSESGHWIYAMANGERLPVHTLQIGTHEVMYLSCAKKFEYVE